MIANDLADRLPETARNKLLLIDGLASDADDLANVAQTRLNKLARFPGGDDNPNAVRLAAKAAVQADRHRALLDLVHACERWLRAAASPHMEFEMAAAALPSLGDGESAEEAVMKIRREVAELTVERMQVERLPEPLPIIRESFRREVARLGAQASPRLDFTRGRAKPVFEARDFIGPEFVFGVLAWLFPDAMAERLDAEAERLIGGAATLATAEQERELARLAERIEELERAEEGLISLAFDNGADVLRRPNADPKCVLGLRVVAASDAQRRRPRPAGPWIEQQAAE